MTSFDLFYLMFFALMVTGCWWGVAGLAIMLFIFSLWDAESNKAWEQKEIDEWNRKEEKRKSEEEFLMKEEMMKKKYPELCYDSVKRKGIAIRLAFHDRTGHLTPSEKELLQVLISRGDLN